jgi:hypothetical protein
MTSSRRRLGLQSNLLGQQQQQQQSVLGVEYLALWTKRKNKTNHGGRQGPKFGAPPQGGESRRNNGQKRDMSTMRFFSCGEMGHYAGQCPKKKKMHQDVSAMTS